MNPAASGYQLGWVDVNGFAWYVPDNNLRLFDLVPPLITWNTTLPFASASSWNTYPALGTANSTGRRVRSRDQHGVDGAV